MFVVCVFMIIAFFLLYYVLLCVDCLSSCFPVVLLYYRVSVLLLFCIYVICLLYVFVCVRYFRVLVRSCFICFPCIILFVCAYVLCLSMFYFCSCCVFFASFLFYVYVYLFVFLFVCFYC